MATSAGNYTFSVYDAVNGCTSTSVVAVVQDVTTPTLTASFSNSLNCVNATATLTAISAGNNMAWNGGSLSNAVNPAVVSALGNYSVTATNPNNGCTTTSVISVTQDTLTPNISASVSGTLNCNTTSVTLTGSSTTSGVTFTWQPQNVNTNTAVTTSAGNYTFAVTDPVNGCSSNTIVTVNSVLISSRPIFLF